MMSFYFLFSLRITGGKQDYEAHIADLKAEITHLKIVIEKILCK
jgi:hypothetical protein